MSRFTSIVLHHSAGPSGSVKVFDALHRGRGWSGIGYHWLIGNGRGGKDGELQQGRSESRDAAGVWGNNRARRQIVLVGNFEENDPGFTGPPTAAQLRTLGEWLITHGKEDGIPADRIFGHREIALKGHGTACPGSLFPLKEIRQWYGGTIGQMTARPLDVFLGASEPEGFRITLNGKPADVRALLQDGTTWVAVKDLAGALGWPEPVYTGGRNVTDVRTR
jgi:hypothetical protein